MLLPPGRFSTTTGCPSLSETSLLTLRISVSTTPPAGYGTMTLSAWVGKLSAAAAIAGSSAVQAIARPRTAERSLRRRSPIAAPAARLPPLRRRPHPHRAPAADRPLFRNGRNARDAAGTCRTSRDAATDPGHLLWRRSGPTSRRRRAARAVRGPAADPPTR